MPPAGLAALPLALAGTEEAVDDVTGSLARVAQASAKPAPVS